MFKYQPPKNDVLGGGIFRRWLGPGVMPHKGVCTLIREAGPRELPNPFSRLRLQEVCDRKRVPTCQWGTLRSDV